MAQAFGQWIDSWMVQDHAAFRERSRMVSAQSWATVRGTMVRSPDGGSEPWLQVFTDHPVVGNITGWTREVLPVLQQPLCNLPILGVATMLDVGAIWLYDRQLRRVIPATKGSGPRPYWWGPSNLHGSGEMMHRATSRRCCYLHRREMTTWLPTPVTR